MGPINFYFLQTTCSLCLQKYLLRSHPAPFPPPHHHHHYRHHHLQQKNATVCNIHTYRYKDIVLYFFFCYIKSFWDQICVWTKHFLRPKICWTHNFFEPKIFWIRNLSGPNILLNPTFFWIQNNIRFRTKVLKEKNLRHKILLITKFLDQNYLGPKFLFGTTTF